MLLRIRWIGDGAQTVARGVRSRFVTRDRVWEKGSCRSEIKKNRNTLVFRNKGEGRESAKLLERIEESLFRLEDHDGR